MNNVGQAATPPPELSRLVSSDSVSSELRLCIVHKNVKGVLGRVTLEIAKHGLNITEHVMKTQGPLGYQIVDVSMPREQQFQLGRWESTSKFGLLVAHIRALPEVESIEVGRFADGVDPTKNSQTPCVRLCVVNDNVVGILGNISSEIGKCNANIVGEVNKSHGNLAYNVLELEATKNLDLQGIVDRLVAMDGVHSCDVGEFKPGALAAVTAAVSQEQEEQRQQAMSTNSPTRKKKKFRSLVQKSIKVKKLKLDDGEEQASASQEKYYSGSGQVASARSSKFSLMVERGQMTENSSRLVLAMVGLPARGKSFIARKLDRFMRWKCYNTKIFNAGKYRRDNVAPEISGASSFYDPDNKQAKQQREAAAEACMLDMIRFFEEEDGEVAIFDATNSVEERRKKIIERCAEFANVIFVEVLCDDEEVLEENILVKVRTSPDFKGMALEDAIRDMKRRISNYESVYEPLGNDKMAYIKLYNLNSKILANRIYGRMTRSILPYLLSLHVGGRPILFTRAGLAQGSETLEKSRDPSTKSKVAKLSSEGQVFAKRLSSWIKTALWTIAGGDEADLKNPGLERHRSMERGELVMARKENLAKELQALKVMMSTLPRARESVEGLDLPDARMETVTLLNPLDKGTFVGQSMQTIEREHPEFYETWAEDPFRVRFPGGESYYDLMVRLESVIIEIEQHTCPVLIVSHVSCIQVLLAYFLGQPITEAMHIEVPMHTVIELSPVLGGSWKEKYYPLG